jgi:HPt (histidine-containing phosphotransfer) domain-containing protein
VTDTIALRVDALDVIAPFSLIIDEHGAVARTGPSLALLCGDVVGGDALFDRFVPITAGMRAEIGALHARLGTILELQHRASGARLRGTVLAVEQSTAFLFVGAPVFDSAEALAASGLTELDFAPGDQTFAGFERLAAAQPPRLLPPDGLIEAVQLERLTGLPGQTRATLAGDLLEMFANRFKGSLQLLREAARKEDHELVRHEAHALKGSALTVGASAIGALCGRIEDDARNGRLDDFDERCTAIESRWTESAPFLWQIVERRSAR